MSCNTVALRAQSCQKYNVFWPKNLDEIKVSEEEKEILQSRIEALVNRLPPKTADNDPSIGELRSESCPRRLYIGHNYYLVVLNSKGGMSRFSKSGAQQKKIKYVWDCFSGTFWLKKGYLSLKQAHGLRYLKYAPDVGISSLGLPRLIVDTGIKKDKGKLRYFEEMGTQSLPEWLKEFGPKLEIKYIIGLMDALRKIHSVKYQPSSFLDIKNSQLCSRYGHSHTFFHGDVSPNNVICKKNDSVYPTLMFTDFYGLGNINNILWTIGWGSPESIQFAKTGTKYQEMTVSDFMVKYGAKKDTWAMGLIIGSLIRGGMHPNYKQNLPCFSFITDKLKFDSTRQYVVDESELANITQEEIDSKIDALIKETSVPLIKTLWIYVKKCLIIDPDKRPTMADHFLEMS